MSTDVCRASRVVSLCSVFSVRSVADTFLRFTIFYLTFIIPAHLPSHYSHMNLSNPTPMLRQYQELKQQHPGTLLFFRLGDFYELFFDDAVVGSRELQITLTARQKESGNPVPMCGVPHH